VGVAAVAGLALYAGTQAAGAGAGSWRGMAAVATGAAAIAPLKGRYWDFHVAPLVSD